VFRLTFGLSGSAAPLPTLVMSYPGYDRTPIELDPVSPYQTPHVRIAGARITVGDPVTLVRPDAEAPPYDPASPPPGRN
jgi:hypothetical protein